MVLILYADAKHGEVSQQFVRVQCAFQCCLQHATQDKQMAILVRLKINRVKLLPFFRKWKDSRRQHGQKVPKNLKTWIEISTE